MSESQSRTAIYRGHTIQVEAFEQRPGVWSFTYLIDREHSGSSTSKAALPDAESALRRGMLAAEARADGLG